MDFRCPSCQKDLTVPDEYAGQLMKCPLCQNTFQAPSLPPPVAPSPPAAPETYGVATEPAAPPPHLPQEVPQRNRDVPAPPPAPPPPAPTGDYAHTRTIWISPRVVPWLAPLALLLAFLLSICFTWAYVGSEKEIGRIEIEHNAWGWGWTQLNTLTLLYTLMLVFALLLSLAIAVLRQVPGFQPPAALQQIWAHRAAFVVLFTFLGLFFLAMQLAPGFTPKDKWDADKLAMLRHTTPFLWLALLLQFVAFVGALLEWWVDARGPSRPIPRIDIHS